MKANNEVNSEGLLTFLSNAHRNTYAALKEVRQKSRLETSFLPGHKCYYFKEEE